MILPIIPYGNPVLRKVAEDFQMGDAELKELIANMFETMYAANGVGLAAPQIGMAIRLFVVDGRPMNEEDEEDENFDPSLIDFKKAFINPTILEEEGEEWVMEEGCLSIPGIRGEVERPEKVLIHYFNENGEEREEWYDGLAARIIQHEYDHIEGILFTDHLTPLKKRLLKNKLNDISKGNVSVSYKMKFSKK